MDISINQISELSYVSVYDSLELPLAVEMVKKNKVDGIALSFIKNWPENDINIIADCPNIKFLSINYAPFDFSVINQLERLVHLNVHNDDRSEINFSNKPDLITVSLFWRPKAKSLFECSQLQNLWIGKFKGKDLSQFKNFSNLKSLRVNTGSFNSLNGIKKLSNLEDFYLAQTSKLEDISEIETLIKLKSLTIDNCKRIKNIEIVNKIPNLESLSIMGSTPKNGVQQRL